MLPELIEQQFQSLAQQVEMLDAALVQGDVAALEAASQAVRQAAVSLHALAQRLPLDEAGRTEFRQRLLPLSQGLGQQRGNLARRAVGVDRALEIMLPQSRESTYAPESATYGSATRQSGAFKYLSA